MNALQVDQGPIVPPQRSQMRGEVQPAHELTLPIADVLGQLEVALEVPLRLVQLALVGADDAEVAGRDGLDPEEAPLTTEGQRSLSVLARPVISRSAGSNSSREMSSRRKRCEPAPSWRSTQRTLS